jgi:cytochrome P450
VAHHRHRYGDLVDRETTFPIGASITLDDLTNTPYDVLALLRSNEPVSWLPALGAWFVTRRDLAIEAMKDADRFTVDDERFTTAKVLGTSMLSLDGPEHLRHRSAFTAPFRPKFIREELEQRIAERAKTLVSSTLMSEPREIRAGVAGPLAVHTILDVLGLVDVDASDVLSWYGAFGDAIVALTIGDDVPTEVHATLAQLYSYVGDAMGSDDTSLIRSLVDERMLRLDEIPAAVAVVMFGAIETSEGMTANAFFHLLSNADSWEMLGRDRSLIPQAIDESLRLEPAATWIDRYTTADAELGDVHIPERELVTINLLAANRDPEVFEEPDTFDLERPNLARHVTFVQGPHACIGLHVARAETHAAITAALDWEQATGQRLTLDGERSAAPTGLIFRKPRAVSVQPV